MIHFFRKTRLTVGVVSTCLAAFMILTTGCAPKRSTDLLIVYSEVVPQHLLGLSSNYTLDTLRYSHHTRPGRDLEKYREVILLSDPGVLNIQWQTDMERYVRSGGGLLVPKRKLNQYQWHWLFEQLGKQENSGVTPFSSIDELNTGFIKSHMGSEQIADVEAPVAPDWSRFTRKVLDADVNEPMELAVLPGGKVLFIEREGNLKLYDPESNSTKRLHTFRVSTEGNYEDGMLGITADPDFQQNSWIYIYYSPFGGHGRQNLSRFYLAYEDSLILSSEKVILEVLVQRKTCCHSGGSITFGPDGNLYLSTGDNTSSKESEGYSPLDERPGRAPFDAQKSSGNANDLRGKILRITPTKEGSYTVPDGNLFPKDGSQGRPEIYAMGCRNPFRFSVDQKNGWVYWGDVGPDSGKDSELGPKSYDEWNLAKKPGNYGWPYFVADNKGYPMFDFAAEMIGPQRDPDSPINRSPNNTGVEKLPPARGSMIWYAYDQSDIWPMLGQGSRSAMAGPVYYTPKGRSKVAFPDYYEGKLFIYEWARSWIKVVTVGKDGELLQIEPFLPEEDFVKPIDMEFGPDGAMYLLEYGENYFANNVEARLVKIEYTGDNRLPIPKLTVENLQGGVPLTTTLSAEGSFDYDEGDSLTYFWQIGEEQFSGKTISYTFSSEGKHLVRLTVSDQSGESSSAETTVVAGNEPAVIDFQFAGNQSFFFDKGTYAYAVAVEDQEDGSTSTREIRADQVQVTFSYLEQGLDLALMGEEFFSGQTNLTGKLLMENSDCNTCHALNTASVGPDYVAIAHRYRNDPDAPNKLAAKVIEGGNGVWGHALMAAHPQHSTKEALEMVNYILSLGRESPAGLDLQGSLTFNQHKANPEGRYLLAIRYTDKGGTIGSPVTTTRILEIRPPVLEAEQYDFWHNVQQQRPHGGTLAYVSDVWDGSYIGFKGLDLSGIREMIIRLRVLNGGILEVRQGGLEGMLAGRLSVERSTGEPDWQEYRLALTPEEEIKDVYFVFSGSETGHLFELDRIEVRR